MFVFVCVCLCCWVCLVCVVGTSKRNSGYFWGFGKIELGIEMLKAALKRPFLFAGNQPKRKQGCQVNCNERPHRIRRLPLT